MLKPHPEIIDQSIYYLWPHHFIPIFIDVSLYLKAGEGVVNGPGDDHVVVDHNEEGDDQHTVPKALDIVALVI